MGSMYGSNEDNPEFYVNVVQQIESIPNDNIIIGGGGGGGLTLYLT